MNKSKKVIKPNVVGGGVAIPLGNNFYFMRGRKHEQGGIDVGPNNENGLEVEGGEVMQMGGKHVKVYSSLPILNGKSPAQLVMAGIDPDKVFNAQERFKDINKLNDDGSRKARFGLFTDIYKQDAHAKKSNANFIKRLKDPNRAVIPDWEHEGYVANFKMASTSTDNGHYVFPMVQEVNGKLVDYTRPPYRREFGVEQAFKNGNVVKFDNLDDAINYAEHYKDVNPGFKRLGGTNRHFTINGNIVNKAGYVPSTGERPQAAGGTITKDEFLGQLPSNNLTPNNDNITIEANNVIKPDLSVLRNNPKLQPKPFDFTTEMSNAVNKMRADNAPEGYLYKNGVIIPTLETYKKHELTQAINESVRRSDNRTSPTNIVLKRGLTNEERKRLQEDANNESLRPDQRSSALKQLEDDCLYGYTCATTSSSNMPRINKITDNIRVPVIDKNTGKSIMALTPYSDRKLDIKNRNGYFASNADFRANYEDYGYRLKGDYRINGENPEVLNLGEAGDLIQEWRQQSDGFKPRHLMTLKSIGDNIVVNDTTGQFSDDAVRKNKKIDYSKNKHGYAIYEFVGDDIDNANMEANYEYLYGNGKRLGGKRRQATLGTEEDRNNLYLDYIKPTTTRKEKRKIRKEFNKLSKELDIDDNETLRLTRFAGDDGTYLKTRKNKSLKVDKNKEKDNTDVSKPQNSEIKNEQVVKKNGNNKVDKKDISRKEKSVTAPKLETFDITSLSKNLEQYNVNEEKRANRKKWWRDNGSDVISGVAKGGASLASYLINKNMLNDLKYVGQPVFTPAAKLKTKININPQIDAIDRTTAAKNANVSANTASSKVRNARMNANYIDRLGYLNELYGMKENKETELINKDKLNQQEITKGNIQAYNDWTEKKQTFENTVRDKQSENAVSFVTNLAKGVDDILSNRLKRKQFDQNIAAIKARNPNVPDELLEETGVTVINRLGGLNTRKLKIRKPNK